MDGACVRYEENNLTVDNKGTKINSFGEHTILNGDFLWFDNVHRRIEIIASEQSLYFYNLEEYGAIGNSYADLSVGKSTVITRDDSPMAKSLFSEVGIDLVEINNRGAVIKIFNSSLSEEYKLRCVELGDRGRNLEMKGKVFGYDFASNEPIVLEDHCDEEGYLWEYSCKENFTQGNRDNINAERVPCVYGCVDGTCEGARQCSSLGFRENSKFCSSANYFMPQKDKDEFCENNFECLSNSCLDSKCVEVGLWTKILNWFRNLFG
jgi:hypothetical protein